MPRATELARINDFVRGVENALIEQRMSSHRSGTQADVAPPSPVNRDDRVVAPAPCKGVEERVCRRIIHLAGGRSQRTHRRKQRQEIKGSVLENFVEHQGSLDLGSEHPRRTLARLDQQRAVLDYARRVDDSVYGAESLAREMDRLLHFIETRDVGTNGQHLRAQGLNLEQLAYHLLDPVRNVTTAQGVVPLPGGWQRRAPNQDKPCPEVPREMVGNDQADSAQTSCDQIHALFFQAADVLIRLKIEVLKGLCPPLAGPVGNDSFARASGKLGHYLRGRLFRAIVFKIHIDRLADDSREFFRQDLGRTQQGGSDRRYDWLPRNRLQSVGDHTNTQGHEVLLTQHLGEEQETVKTEI